MHLPPPSQVEVRPAETPHEQSASFRTQTTDTLTRETAAHISTLLQLPSSPELQKAVLPHAERCAHERRRMLDSINAESLESYPVGRACGTFAIVESQITFTATENISLYTLISKIYGLKDPSSISSAMIDELLQGNPGLSSDSVAALVELRERVANRSFERPEADLRPVSAGTTITLPASQTSELALLTTTHLLAVVRELQGASKNEATRASLRAVLPSGAQLKEKETILERSEIFNKVAVTRHQSASLMVNATTLLQEGSVGSSDSFVRSAQECLRLHDEMIRGPLTSQREGAQLLDEDERVGIVARLQESQVALAAACREVFIARAAIRQNNNDVVPTLEDLRTALYFDLEEAVARGGESTSFEQIWAQSINTVTLSIARSENPPSNESLGRMRGILKYILPPGAGELAIVDGLTTLRYSLQIELANGTSSRSTLTEVQSKIDAMAMYARREAGISDAGEIDSAKIASSSARMRAVEATVQEMLGRLESRDYESVARLNVSLASIIKSEPDASIRNVLAARTIASFTPHILKASNYRTLLKESLISCGLAEMSTTPDGQVSAKLRFYLEDTSRRITSDKHSDLLSQRFTDETKELCKAAVHTTRTHSILTSYSVREKEALFEELLRDHQMTIETERKELQRYISERNTLVRELENPAKDVSEISAAVARGKLAAIDIVVERLSRSIVANSVEMATLALQADTARLLGVARKIIDDIPKEALRDEQSKTLVATFSSSHAPSSQLIAAGQEFLKQLVRDKPLHTFGYMIAAGLLGAGLASWYRRRPSEGFLAASSATLAGVKLYCVLTGLPIVNEAFAHQLTYATPLSSSLDALYLFTDLAQVSLLIGAYRKLRSFSPQESPIKAGRGWVNEIAHEATQLTKVAVSQLDPRALGFYLIGIPISVGTYQIMNAPLPFEDQMTQMRSLILEVIPILAVALIHDRIAARLKEDQERRALLETASIPPLPNLRA